MGFITMFHHHLGEYVLLFPSIKQANRSPCAWIFHSGMCFGRFLGPGALLKFALKIAKVLQRPNHRDEKFVMNPSIFAPRTGTRLSTQKTLPFSEARGLALAARSSRPSEKSWCRPSTTTHCGYHKLQKESTIWLIGSPRGKHGKHSPPWTDWISKVGARRGHTLSADLMASQQPRAGHHPCEFRQLLWSRYRVRDARNF